VSAPDLKKPILRVHESTLPALNEIERIFLDRFVADGRAVIVPNEPGASV